MTAIKQTINTMLLKRGYVHAPRDDVEADFMAMYERCREFTMTSLERMYALYRAVEYVAARGLRGDIVECGVWRGGSSMLAALTLQKLGDDGRSLFLYDTYAGMTRPSDRDGVVAKAEWAEHQRGDLNEWCRSSLEEVKANMASTGYPAERRLFIEGRVEDTIPGIAPEEIAVLRLDTDFYESTYHELRHLYPRLATAGVLIIDDYGHWRGAREAVDRYFDETGEPLLLNRIDYTGRIAVKA